MPVIIKKAFEVQEGDVVLDPPSGVWAKVKEVKEHVLITETDSECAITLRYEALLGGGVGAAGFSCHPHRELQVKRELAVEDVW